MTVSVQFLEELPSLHPYVYKQYELRNVTVQKMKQTFPKISDDHVHEQKNKVIKQTGRIIGIIDSHRTSQKSMIGGSVISEIINTFENEYFDEYVTSNISLKHLENTEAHKTKFTEKHRRRWYH